jgi:outer membrane protein assembly factor BamB
MFSLRAFLRVFVPSWWFFLSVTARAGDNWPQFRGPHADGHSDSTGLPVKWSETQNIKWKIPIPGQGWSSPVIHGDQIWCTAALQSGVELRAICIDKNTGRIVHNIEVFHVPNPEKKHTFNSYASPTPVLEAGRVYICFGDNGSACLDTVTGKMIWENHELKIDHMNGPGSSPVVYKNLYLLCCDGIDQEYVAALDKNTGKLVWKTQRSVNFDGVAPDIRKAYNTPIVVKNEGREELISIGAHRVYSYDVFSGKELWYCDHPGFSCVAQPQFADGMVYMSTGFGKADLWAIRADGAGDVSKTHIAWKFKKGVPCRSTPLLVGEGNDRRLYMSSDDGLARCVRAADGEMVWQGRIGTDYSASPLFADGRIYFFDEKGTSTVIAPGDSMKVLAENHLDDGCMGTPAISGKALFVRTKTSLYRIEQ